MAKSDSQRLRRLLRRFKKDQSVVEITNWYWYDTFEHSYTIERNTDIISFEADYTWYAMRRDYNNLKFSTAKNREKIISTECKRLITIGSSDCLCYNYLLDDNFKLEKTDNDNYSIKYNGHEIKIHRLTETEYKRLIHA